MSCFKPITAWQPVEGGQVYFCEMPNTRAIEIPCGQCIGCRIDRSKSWSVRIMHEAQLHDENCFITLTYNDENMPLDAGLKKKIFKIS